MNPQTDTPESAEAANFSVSFALNRLKSLADEIADNGNDESWPREIMVAVENIKDARAILTAQQSDTALKLQRCEEALREIADNGPNWNSTFAHTLAKAALTHPTRNEGEKKV